MGVIQFECYRNGNLTNEIDTQFSRMISITVNAWKGLGYHVRDISRGVDDFPFVDVLLVEGKADMEVPFVEVQGQYVHLVFKALPDYDDGYDMNMVEGL